MNYAFQIAARNGDLNQVMDLAPGTQQIALDTAFYMAVMNGHLRILRYLVEHTDANPAANDNIALISALEKGYTDVANYLITLPAVQNVGIVPIVERYAGLITPEHMQWLLRNLDANRFFADTELLDLSLEYNYLMMIPVLEDHRYRITDEELLLKYLQNMDFQYLIRALKVPQIFQIASQDPEFDDLTQPVVNYLNRYLPHWRDIPVTGRSLQTQSLKKILDLQL